MLQLRVAAARHGVAGAAPRPIEAVAAWPGTVALLERERLVGLTRRLVADDLLAVDAETATELQRAHERLVGRDLVLERELLASLREWRVDPAEVRVLKGPAMARLDEHHPCDRSYVDIDLLVAAGAIDRVVAAARSAGATRTFPEPRPGYDRRFGKGVNLVRSSQMGIDLHRTLALGPFGLALDPDDLFAGGEPLVVGDTELTALDARHRFLHACYHAVLGHRQPPLVALRDVALSLPQGRRGVEEVLATAHRWRGGAVVAAAVAAAVDGLHLELEDHPLVRWARGAPTGPVEARWLSAYREQRSSVLQALYGAEALHGVRPRAAYVVAVGLPRSVRSGEALDRRWRRAVGVARRSLRSA